MALRKDRVASFSLGQTNENGLWSWSQLMHFLFSAVHVVVSFVVLPHPKHFLRLLQSCSVWFGEPHLLHKLALGNGL